VREVAIKREANECKRAMKNQISQKRSKNYDRLSKDKPLETVDADNSYFTSPLTPKKSSSFKSPNQWSSRCVFMKFVSIVRFLDWA